MEKTKLATIVTMLLLSMLVIPLASGLASASDKIEIHSSSDSPYTAGSTIIIPYVYDGNDEISMPVGKQILYYRLINPEGKTVFIWRKEPDAYWYDHKIGNLVYGIHTRDHFDCTLPVMWWEDEGEWKIEITLHDESGDELYDAARYAPFHVSKGSFMDNFKAPIYLYKAEFKAGILLGEVRWELPAPCWLTSPVWIMLAIFLFIFIVKHLFRSAYEQFEASVEYIRKKKEVKI